MGLGLSDRAAGQIAGVSHTAIRKAREARRIRVLADGSVDPAGIAEWQAGRRAPRGGVSRKVSATSETPAVSTDGPAAENAKAALEATMAPGGVFATREQAERARDSYVAHLRRLEYETKRGNLIEIEIAAQSVERDYAEVRSKILAIAPEQAPQLHRCKTVMELQDMLTGLLTDALEALSRGGVRQPLSP